MNSPQSNPTGKCIKGHRGRMAFEELGLRLELTVLHSNAGYYIGTYDEEGPVSRESEEYYRTREAAQYALDNNEFTQNWVPR